MLLQDIKISVIQINILKIVKQDIKIAKEGTLIKELWKINQLGYLNKTNKI